MHNAMRTVLLALSLGAPALAQPDKPASANHALTSEQIGQLLKDMGLEPTAPSPDVWHVSINRDCWKVNVMVSRTPDGERLWLESKFAVIAEPEAVPASAWLKLLVENERIGPAYFSFDKSDKRIHLYKVFDNSGITSAKLKKELDGFDATVRKTQHVWRSENYARVESLSTIPRPVDDEAKKAAGIDGTWRIVRLETKGESLTEDQLAVHKPCVIFAETKAIFRTGLEPERHVRVKIDPAQKPKVIDFIDENGRVEAGIFIMETGLLTVCVASVGEERPRQFVTDPKNKFWLLVLKKEE